MTRITVAAEIIRPAGLAQPIQVSELTLTMDSAVMPNWSGTITTPYTPEVAALDPQASLIELRLTFTEIFARLLACCELTATRSATCAAYTAAVDDVSCAALTEVLSIPYGETYSPPSTRTVTLMLCDIETAFVAQRITLAIASREAQLFEAALVAAGDYTPTETNLLALIDVALGKIGASLFDYDNGLQELAVTDPEQRLWSVGQTAFDWVYELTREFGLFLYCRYDGRFVLRAAHTIDDDLAPLILDDSNLIDASVRRSRRTDADYTAVVLRYNWTAADGTARSASSVFDDGRTPVNVYVETIDGPRPGAGSAAYAYEVLHARAKTIAVDAIADYTGTWLENPTTVVLPGDTTITGTVKAVTWRHPADRMTATIQLGASYAD